MCTKTPETAYYVRKLATTSRHQLADEWTDAPLTRRDREFLRDISDGATLKELSDKYSLTVSGISKWKSRVYKKLHRFDTRH